MTLGWLLFASLTVTVAEFFTKIGNPEFVRFLALPVGKRICAFTNTVCVKYINYYLFQNADTLTTEMKFTFGLAILSSGNCNYLLSLLFIIKLT